MSKFVAAILFLSWHTISAPSIMQLICSENPGPNRVKKYLNMTLEPKWIIQEKFELLESII